jgi:hypothetical protein
MYPMLTPARTIGLSPKTGMMLMEAQGVAGMREMGKAGLWRGSPGGAGGMSTRKVAAVNASVIATVRSILSGKSPARIAEAALKPIARSTKSNVKRLAVRGPGKS